MNLLVTGGAGFIGSNFIHHWLKKYPDDKIKSIMDKSWNDGVEKVVCISNSIKESKRIIEMKDKFENMHFTLGVRPHDAKNFKISDIDGITDFFNSQVGGAGVTRRHHGCSFCKYAYQNELIDDVVTETRHNEFA